MNDKNYEDIKSIIVSTVSLLCKNGLSHQQLKIEGLLAVTVNNKDIVLINFAEHFTRETIDSTPSSSVLQKPAKIMQESELSTLETSSNSTFNDGVTSDFNKSVLNAHENNKEMFLVELRKDAPRYSVKNEIDDTSSTADPQYLNQYHAHTANMQNSINKFDYCQNNFDVRTTRGRKTYKHHCTKNMMDYSNSQAIETSLITPYNGQQKNLFLESTCQNDIDTLFRKQYICEFPGCCKPYSTRRSMLRHQTVAHGRIPCFKKSKSYNQVMNEVQSHAR